MWANIPFGVVVATSVVWLLSVDSHISTSLSPWPTPFPEQPRLLKLSRKNSSHPGKIKCDLYCCNCNGKRARCSGKNRKLIYVPQLPAEIRDFRIFRSKFYLLNRTMMSNLSNFLLETMNLTNNGILQIDADTFADFPKIQVLDLSFNLILIPELGASLRGMSSISLSTLALGSMGFTSLPDDFFDMFLNRTFQKVNLQKNQFRTFNSALFAPFWRTNKVDMAQNKITDVHMPVRVNIRELYLNGNKLQDFPDLSRNKSQTRDAEVCEEAFYYLQRLVVSSNRFQKLEGRLLRGDCFPHLRHLDISSSALFTLKNDVIADLPALQTFVVSHMNILQFEPYAFNSSSLTKLNLDGNKRFDRDKMDFPQVFKHSPNLQTVTIVDTKLEMTVRDLFSFLLPLKNLQSLQMQRNRLGTIPPDLLWRLPRLRRLVFTGGNLNSYGLGKALENVTSLTHLNVQANGITEVNQSTLPWEFRSNVKWLDMSQNPFSCTCNLLWFRDWLDAVEKNKSVNVNNFANTKQYRCRTPADMRDVSLHKYRPTAESCAVKNPFVLVGVVGGCLLMGLLVLMSFVYRNRWHLRFYVYRLRRRREYTQVPGALLREDGTQVQLFHYDAYLAHSPKDLDWVVDTLLPIVEGQHGLRVFVHDRDSVPGTVLVDNIARYMDESARVMLLISDHYNQDGWRQCEFEHILYAAFEQGKDVIVLLLGDVEAGRMTRDMRRMLTRGTFLQWRDSEEARRAFTNGLKVALATQDVSFQNLC